jgi:hypothetical protein
MGLLTGLTVPRTPNSDVMNISKRNVQGASAVPQQPIPQPLITDFSAFEAMVAKEEAKELKDQVYLVVKLPEKPNYDRLPLSRLPLSRQLGRRSSSPSLRGSREALWSTSSTCSKHFGKGEWKTRPAASGVIVWNRCRRNSYRSPIGSNGMGSGVLQADAAE